MRDDDAPSHGETEPRSLGSLLRPAMHTGVFFEDCRDLLGSNAAARLPVIKFVKRHEFVSLCQRT